MSARTQQIDLSALRELVEDLGIQVATWSRRDDDPTKGQPLERAAAGDAVGTIDAMLAKLHRLRSQLVTEIRRRDDAFMAALDEKYGPVR
ncbi:hypothetical protein [Prauserella flavalba]|uniref:Uncharacterized protein n=1 Tax=Prauserella flavalba TaxID=1477506 RepID=A0A318L941_9PSEU|nr:hypothetical protein [Prauserella flavalba]PXY17330.1 hypothetical protein BA062_37610 [Prauserella flavalba]